MLTCSIGVMAYNEAANLGRLLGALSRQELTVCSINGIYVVASGCSDGTEEIAREFATRDQRVKLLVQQRREGKASAVNLFLATADADVFVLESADTVPESRAVDKLVAPFLDPHVGMTGARPVPVDGEDTFIGYSVNLMWRLHHRIALENPKLGEMVAFRSVVREIPRDTAVDEASIEAIVTAAGLSLRYVGDAVVYNKGPESVGDFLKQRRRIAAGHIYVRRTQRHSVATASLKHTLRSLGREMRWGAREVLWTAGAVGLEAAGRALGYYDYMIRRRNPVVWEVAWSTKRLKGGLQ